MLLRDRDTNGDGTLDERLWVVQDANYNVTALFDNSGSVVERYAYDPFGNVTVLDADFNLKSAGSDYAWIHLHQGGRYDSVSGLYHFRFRDYSPTLGRWTRLDPLRYEAGDVNLYRALGNSPVNRVDPSGLVWSWLSAAIGAAIGTVIGVGVYVGYNAFTGRPITWGGIAGAAAGGAVAGGIAGGFVGAATGDPSALTVIGGGVLIGAGSGAAGGFTGSIVSQGIDQGRIDWGQVAVDTGTGAVIGGVTGGVLGGGKVLLRPRPGVAPRTVPQGLTEAQFNEAAAAIRAKTGHIEGELVVHGSRAAGKAKPTSDIDFAIRVSQEQFDALIKARFGTPNPGSAKFRTMQHAVETGKIQAGEAGLRGLRVELERMLGMRVDISVIRKGGPFDNPPFIPLPN